MATGALATLTNVLPDLTPSERRVARFIMADPESVLRMTVADLSRGAKAGSGTVVRLCQRAGWQGFAELKLRLAADLAVPDDVLHVDLARTDGSREILRKLSAATTQAIRNTQKVLSVKALNAAVKAIVTGTKTEFYGLGTSGLTGLNAKMRFRRIGIPCDAHTDIHFQRMAASRLGKGDVAFFISHSGATKEILDVLRIAKGKNARCVALTNHSRSPIAQAADIVLLTAVREPVLATGTMQSEIAQLFAINLLYVAVAMKNVPGMLEKEVGYLEALSDFP